MLRRKLLATALALTLVPVAALATDEGVEVDPVAPVSTPMLEIDVMGEAEGTIVIELRPDLAPAHVARIIELAEAGTYDGVVFHRVIDGFMAQTGDVQYGRRGGDLSNAGYGGSDLPNLPAEFTDTPFERGVMGMARGTNPNSANSQFFLMFDAEYRLNGQYTVLGEIVEGLDVLDAIKRGRGRNGAVLGDADYMAQVRVIR